MSRSLLAALSVAFLFTAACAAEDAESSRDWDEIKTPKKSDADSCTPKTCNDIGASEGEDDGCGGKISCSEEAADDDCVPKTCEELGKTTGKADNGCGKQIDCAAEMACNDGKGNRTKETAVDLGAMTDYPGDSDKKVAADLKLGDSEAWFKFKVTDSGFNGNPKIKATSSSTNAEVSVFYVCDGQGDASACSEAEDAADTTVGKGCRGTGETILSTACNSWSDHGVGFVRVKKSAPDAQCSAYTLTVRIKGEYTFTWPN